MSCFPPSLQELDAACRQLIIDHHRWVNSFARPQTTLPCVFADILDQVERRVKEDGLSFREKKEKLASIPLRATQFCHTHNGFCSLREKVCVDVSGLPCPDNSRANQKRKFEEGSSGIVYLTWSKFHIEQKTPLLILENVPENRLN